MRGEPILQVEDDEHDVLFLRRAFEAAGIRNSLIVARDGQEAIAYLSGVGEFGDREKHPLPCLIILDLKMPRRTGLEVLEWLRREPGLACVPVIMFSASAHDTEVERACQLGANSFVVKPQGTQERVKFARAVKDYWLHFHAAPWGGSCGQNRRVWANRGKR